MSLFSRLFGETTEKKVARWKQELKKALSKVLSEENVYDLGGNGSKIVIRHGSAYVIVGFGVDEDDNAYVLISSPLVYLPRENLLPFYRKLLDLNNEQQLLGRLATDGKTITHRCTIPMEGLSEKAFCAYVFALMEEADILDDQLIEEFRTRRAEPFSPE